MPHDRPKSPGSFQDELGGVIERIAPKDGYETARPKKPEKRAVKHPVELNDRLFGKAWRKSD